MMSSHLRLVESKPSQLNRFELLLIRPGGLARMVAAEEQDGNIPLIDLSCSEFYTPTGGMIDAGPYGRQVEVSLEIMAGGRRRTITGAAVALEDGLGVVLPRETRL